MAYCYLAQAIIGERKKKMKKQNFKKRLAYLLTLLMLTAVIPVTASAANSGELIVNGQNILNATDYTVA